MYYDDSIIQLLIEFTNGKEVKHPIYSCEDINKYSTLLKLGIIKKQPRNYSIENTFSLTKGDFIKLSNDPSMGGVVSRLRKSYSKGIFTEEQLINLGYLGYEFLSTQIDENYYGIQLKN